MMKTIMKGTVVGTGVGVGGAVVGAGVVGIIKRIIATDTIFTNFDTTSSKRYVNGPSNITHYKLRDKEIYMFGEFHFPVNHCDPKLKNTIGIPIIFDYIIKSNPQIKIDFFFEKQDRPNPFINYAMDVNDSIIPMPILITRGFFSACSTRLGCELYWPNLRMHGIDVRQTNDFLLSFLMNFLGSPGTKITGGTGLMEKLYAKFLDPVRIFEEYKINDQINGITDDKLKAEILTYAGNELNKKIENYNQTNYAMDMFDIMAFYVDIYAIARIFRTFGEYDSKYIMIYVGDQHRYMIDKFLNSLKPKIEKYGDLKKPLEFLDKLRKGEITDYAAEFKTIPQCVNIMNSNLPFFDTAPKLDKYYKKIVTESNSQKELNEAYYAYFKSNPITTLSKLFGKQRKSKRTSKRTSKKSRKRTSDTSRTLRRSKRKSKRRTIRR
jgi:hypothetical protein